MKRGIIPLKKSEVEEAIKYIPQTPDHYLLLNKMTAALNNGGENGQQTGVQVSEEDLELLMDNLPMPSQEDSSELKNLRSSTQIFLSKLRFG
jgi:vacuolar-type H+-ATPase subunit E/Vma4